MLISVTFGNSKPYYTYNAPNSIDIGDEVVVPIGIGGGEIVGTVAQRHFNAARKLAETGWSGPIKAIIGKHEPLAMAFEAHNKDDLRRQLEDALEDLAD